MSTLYRNGWLADGRSRELKKAVVLTEGDRIVAVEEQLFSSAADRVVDLRGMVLAPGFIDVHGHSEVSLLARPDAFGRISQGITTEIAGNCGLSVFPISDRNREHLQQLYERYNINLDWSDINGWKETVARIKPAVRLESLIGHNTLRAAVAGYEQRELTQTQIEDMGWIMRRAFENGALGLSAGLLYVPGKFASKSELVEMMRVVAHREKVFTVHLRSEGRRLIESLEEVIECAREAELNNLEISHFKCAGPDNWYKLEAAICLIERARSEGMRIHVDRYPYIESMTPLSVILPEGYDDLADSDLAELLKSTGEAAKLVIKLENARNAKYWENVILISTDSELGRDYAGCTITELAGIHHLAPARLVVDLLCGDAAGTNAAFKGMSEENLKRIIALPYCMMGSDESARSRDFDIGRSHPRGFGAAAKFLRCRLDDGAPVGEAVRQMSSMAADKFALNDRGELAPGKLADMVVFNPDEVDAQSTFVNPHEPARGIECTVIGGETVFHA